ncbi:hypothetical protein [Granulosicoccus antarcticus]|uniref:Uncharacterized protein n=1 Tax=Granulosicoccus antarcticus IMCC3135 TaxID=1192854 RepID=A0A2Z2NPP8_9GAMM|nr:hypothetical protein [Granulosicoccus antarcticus]ASJ73426.1 hypothetical protein IMCC3135_16720 [Granulosicoccus antarcticus IMCC3135]
MPKSDFRTRKRAAIFSLRDEQVSAQHTAVWGRAVALLLIALLVTIMVPWPGPLYLYLLLLVFALLGYGAWLISIGQVW